MKKLTLITLILSISIPIFIFYTIKNEYNNIDSINNVNVTNMKDINYYIDKIEIKDDKLNLEGWLIEKGHDNNYFNKSFILISETNEHLIIKTVMKKREDVTINFNDGNKYDNNGMVSILDLDSIDTGVYKLGILIIGEDKSKKIIYTNEVVEIR